MKFKKIITLSNTSLTELSNILVYLYRIKTIAFQFDGIRECLKDICKNNDTV